MSSAINEDTAYFDTAGLPIVDGLVYFGTVNLDPVANPISIFSDSALTVALSNPQTLNSFGRSTSKVWLSGRYSLQVNNSAAVQQYQELDNGEAAESGLTSLSNVQGTNTITADTAAGITAYTDQEIFVFKAANTITGAATLNIDSVGAKDIVRNFDQAMFAGQIVQNQIVQVAYNSSTDDFSWQDQNLKVAYDNKGADIASASTVDLALATGNSIDITGSTGPITSFGTTPAGSVFWLQFDSTPSITHNGTSLIIPGNANITMVAGDTIKVESLGSGNNAIQVFRETGKALVQTPTFRQIVSNITGAVSTVTTVMPIDDTIPQNTEGDEWLTLAITPTSATSTLRIDINLTVANASGGGGVEVAYALFVDSTAAAIAAWPIMMDPGQDQTAMQASGVFLVSSASTTTRTYKVRVGPETSSTITINGEGGNRRFGGVMSSGIIITEFEA